MHDGYFMDRAIGLARAVPSPSPNPRVGAVVVRDGAILAEGVHRGPGEPHAEADALARCDASGATVYVPLEPCSHHGRTPPCADALIAAGVARVVVAIVDPDPRVSGAGIEKLRAHGIRVDVGTGAAAAAELNEAYLHHRCTGRPFVRLKLATSIDGRLAATDGTSAWITGPKARARVHRQRRDASAILVGAGTVVADDPRLSARIDDTETVPLRVIVDSGGRVSPEARAITGPGDAIVATTEACPHEKTLALKEAGAEVVMLPADATGRVDLGALLDQLGRRDLIDLLCEGGGALATSLLAADLVDVLEVHTGSVLLGPGGAAIAELGITTMEQGMRWRLDELERFDDDIVAVYRRGA